MRASRRPAKRRAPPGHHQQAVGCARFGAARQGAAVVLLNALTEGVGWVLVLAMGAGGTKDGRWEKGRRWAISRGAKFVEALPAVAGPVAEHGFRLPFSGHVVFVASAGWDTHGCCLRILAPASGAHLHRQHEFSPASSHGMFTHDRDPRILYAARRGEHLHKAGGWRFPASAPQ